MKWFRVKVVEEYEVLCTYEAAADSPDEALKRVAAGAAGPPVLQEISGEEEDGEFLSLVSITEINREEPT